MAEIIAHFGRIAENENNLIFLLWCLNTFAILHAQFKKGMI